MKTVTKAELAKTAKERYKNQYWQEIFGRWPGAPRTEFTDVYEKLCEPGADSHDKVNEIIGNDAWTELRCDECKKIVDVVVAFESSEWPVFVCHECLLTAANSVALELDI